MKRPIAGILASELSVGSVVKLMEAGTPVDYLVVNQGIPQKSSLYDPSCDGVWLLRNDYYTSASWGTGQSFPGAACFATLNQETGFYGRYGDAERNAIQEVKVPYVSKTTSNGVMTIHSGANGAACKVFFLCCYEVGWTEPHEWDGGEVEQKPQTGARLDYFLDGDNATANEKRKLGDRWWTRDTSYAQGMGYVHYVEASGTVSDRSGNNTCGYRPCIVLSKNALFDKDTLLLKGVV